MFVDVFIEFVAWSYRVHAVPGKRPSFEKTLENLEKHFEKVFFLEKYYASLTTQGIFFNIDFS